MSLLRKISSSFGSSEAAERQSTCDALIEAFLKEHPAPERNAWRGAPEPRKSVAGAQILALDRELRAARSLSEAFELLSISCGQAHRIMERAVARGLERRGLEELDAVGIDEKSFKRTELRFGLKRSERLPDAGSSPKAGNEAVPSDFSRAWHSNSGEKVEAVVTDMSAAFEAAAEAQMPQAEIVHDRFHVAKHLNEAVGDYEEYVSI